MPNRSELSETYDRLMGLAGQLLGLNEEERNFVLDRVAPLPETTPMKTKKKPPKGGSRSSAKSPRAQSLSGAIQRTVRSKAPDDDNDDEGLLCTVGLDSSGMSCGEPADHNIHHLSSHPDYHPFHSAVTPAQRRSSGSGASSAPASGTRSPALPSTEGNGETRSKSASSSTPSFETEMEGVSNAVHAGG